MYSALGYDYDNNNDTGTADGRTPDKLPYRKRNRTPRVNPHEQWKEACYGIYPDFDNFSEAAKEIIETKFKEDYYIALGSNTSLPRTATSGSIQTPRVSPLVRRPSRDPFRTPSAPLIPTRPLPPIGPLPPLPLLPNFNFPIPILSASPIPRISLPPLSPLPPLPPLPPLSPLSPLSPLPPLSPLSPISNPYISSFYAEDKNLPSTSNTSLFAEPYSRKRKPPDTRSFYDPSNSSFSATRLAQPASSYVDSLSTYGQENHFYKTDNKQDDNNNDQPFDYTIDALNQWNF